MNIRNSILAASILVLLAPGLGAAAETPAKTKTGAPDSPAAALKMGAAAETVRQALGKPDEIRPMKAPNGKAEVWVYTKQISQRVEHVGFPTPAIITIVMGADGQQHQQSTPGELQYHDIYYMLEETTEVLMFNDHYVTQKVSRRERQLYH